MEREPQTQQSVENMGMGVEAIQLKLREIGVLGEVCAKFLEEDIDVEGLSLLSHEDMRPWGLLKLVYFRKLQAFASEKMRIQVRGSAQEMAQGGEGGSMRTTTPKATNESGSAETPLSVKNKKKNEDQEYLSCTCCTGDFPTGAHVSSPRAGPDNQGPQKPANSSPWW